MGGGSCPESAWKAFWKMNDKDLFRLLQAPNGSCRFLLRQAKPPFRITAGLLHPGHQVASPPDTVMPQLFRGQHLRKRPQGWSCPVRISPLQTCAHLLLGALSAPQCRCNGVSRLTVFRQLG